MIQRRAIGVFCCMIFFFALCIYRLHYIEASGHLAVAAQGQGRFTVNIAQARGSIYDRNMRLLVNKQNRFMASVLSTPQAMAEIYRVFPEDERYTILERMRGGLPFALELPTLDVYAVGIDVFVVPERYGDVQIAPHLIGYLSDEGRRGVAGIERAYDEILREKGASFTAIYHLDAMGRTMQGAGTVIKRQNETGAGGVVLTLDANIQLVVQRALAAGAEKGAAVVMDVNTGEILAMASVPAFDQNDIYASLDSLNAPFINRAISGYSIGSVFKGVIAAAALESGFSQNRSFDCRGYIDVGGQIFRCNNLVAHGVVDMSRALQVSCNTYFISLGLQLDPGFLLALCRHLGMDAPTELAPGMLTQRGNLPTPAELNNPAALANFSFGQGSSLATPLQIAQIMSTFVNGRAVTPRLVEGLSEDGISISQPAPRFADRDVLSPQTVAIVHQIMIDTVVLGSGWPAEPLYGGAGGKTSSAQTGQWIEDENGGQIEIVHAWFAGFYPAHSPRYSIVVFVEGGLSGEQVAAPIFKQIADGIYALSRR